MVTSDLHIFLNKTLLAASWMLSSIILIRIIFGPLNYWIVLYCLVTLELSITLVGGAFNVSAFVQMSIIMNFKWTSGYNDKKYHSDVPLIQQGFVVLYLGGSDIIPLLSSTPWYPWTYVFFGSITLIFQTSFMLYKSIESRKIDPNPKGYFNQLQVTLIGGLRNSYNIASITIFTSSLILICTVHYLRINQGFPVNYKGTEDIPGIIIILGIFLLFWNFFPFIKNKKLRKFGLKTIWKQFEECLYWPCTRLWRACARNRKLSPTADIDIEQLEQQSQE